MLEHALRAALGQGATSNSCVCRSQGSLNTKYQRPGGPAPFSDYLPGRVECVHLGAARSGRPKGGGGDPSLSRRSVTAVKTLFSASCIGWVRRSEEPP